MRALETRKRVHRTDKTEPSGSEIEGEREAEGGGAGGEGRGDRKWEQLTI